MHRLYEHGDIAVFWNSEKCFHAKRCVSGSPKTFEFGRRPWIDLTKAPAKEIWQTIEKCPSGALSCVYTHEVDIRFEAEKNRSAAYKGEELIGECDFEKTADGWNIFHTEVSPAYGGKGIAKRLVYKLIEAAERAGENIIPSCSYAVKVLGE